jgi:hypothetical protein
MHKSLQRLKDELLGIIPAAVFFFIAFQLLALTRALILQEYGVHVSTFIAATIGALIVAKVVMIVDLLPFVNRFPHKPLAYNIIWKTAIYLLAAFVVRYVEHLIHFVRKYGDLIEANRHLLQEVVWPHFWLIQIWLLVLLLMYCTFRELIRVLGRQRVRALFFGPIKPDIN